MDAHHPGIKVGHLRCVGRLCRQPYLSQWHADDESPNEPNPIITITPYTIIFVSMITNQQCSIERVWTPLAQPLLCSAQDHVLIDDAHATGNPSAIWALRQAMRGAVAIGARCCCHARVNNKVWLTSMNTCKLWLKDGFNTRLYVSLEDGFNLWFNTKIFSRNALSCGSKPAATLDLLWGHRGGLRHLQLISVLLCPELHASLRTSATAPGVAGAQQLVVNNWDAL